MMARESAPGCFPLAANPAAHMASVPYARTLGLVWEGGDASGARVRLPYSSRVALPDTDATDTLATLGLLDHACSAAVYLSLDTPSLIATVDLRVEFAHAHEVASDVVCIARTRYIEGGFAVVRAKAVSQVSGRCVAYASSAYAIGAHPGMQGKPDRADTFAAPANDEAVVDSCARFRDILGFCTVDGGFQLPFHERLIGAVSLPAIHGGATAAALSLATLGYAEADVEPGAGWRPLTVSIHYLRAVQAMDVHLTASLRKRGTRSCVIAASASQDGREVTHAECLLVRTTPASHFRNK